MLVIAPRENIQQKWRREQRVFTKNNVHLDDLRVRDVSPGQAIPADLTADVGLRLDTYVGIFTLSIANALGRIPF